MLVYAGIDEAGYGPLLGPLCVALVVVAVDGIDPAAPDLRAPDLWHALRSAVCAAPQDRKRRIPIADSKRLKGARDGKAHPLRHLELGVLAALASGGDPLPADESELFTRLGVELPDDAEAPWYGSGGSLPAAQSGEAVAIAANRLALATRDAGVRFLRLGCETLDAARFNRLAATSPKSGINFAAAARAIDAVWSGHGPAHPRIVVDRQGGRTLYREPLQISFPEARIAILAETEAISRYRLEDRRGVVTISFEVESESRHLPNALASMTAKYVRELCMARMNRFFIDRLPELRPTAGYVEDGRRYLEAIQPILAAMAVGAERIVRVR